MSSHAPPDTATDAVSRALGRARGILPDQGPIGVFIHHNTLHAFQHLPFDEAVVAGAALTGAKPYLDLATYRDARLSGRIAERDVDEALAAHFPTPPPGALGQNGIEFAKLLMLHDPDVADLPGERFLVNLRGDAAEEALLDASLLVVERSQGVDDAAPPVVHRHRDALVALGHDDPDIAVHQELIRLCAGFLDQGQALLAMPGRSAGFLRAVANLYAAGRSSPGSAPRLAERFAAVVRDGSAAREVIGELLSELGVTDDEAEEFVIHTLLALPGWAGMCSRLEAHPEEGTPDAPIHLEDYLAVRLVIEAAVLEGSYGGLSPQWMLPALRAAVATDTESHDRAACRLFHLTRAAGLDAAAVRALSPADVSAVWECSRRFPPLARRAVFHRAYEGWYRRHVLDALADRRRRGARIRPEQPRAQFIFCIDEREESIRRAIEEQGSDLETFGAAGFFGVAIDYQGLYDVTPAAHCPVVVTPDHEVREAPIYTAQGWHDARRRVRDAWSLVHRLAHRRSRTLGGGAALSFVLGPFAAGLALARVLFPRTSLGAFQRVRERVFPRPATRLATRRPAEVSDRSTRGKLQGFTLAESTDRVANTLRAIGLVEHFAPVVVLLGHGSSSLNNPHESAHDCGACGGRRGGANARLFADMANRQDVRAALADRGIRIPDETWFIGGLHDTADDDVEYYDLDLLPARQAPAFELADHVLQVARERSAQERCRRFHDTPLGIQPADALRHVEARAAHLAQPRPEYGHCTNASCIVGRRELSRGLHLDRRAFLVSYDPSRDPEHAILERTLAAVGPVGAGISLEYYFSSVDNEVYGCGTKLPHNVTGYLGVMNGHQSDLRTGLPLQMVELHEPMRLLLIVEATPEGLLHVASRQAEVRELVVKEWVQLVSCHPETGALMIFTPAGFVAYDPSPDPLPEVRTSPDWHSHARDHLVPALVTAALDPAPVSFVAPA